MKNFTHNSELAKHDNIGCVAIEDQSGNIRRDSAANIFHLFVPEHEKEKQKQVSSTEYER